MKMKPNLFIVGAPKAGSSFLYEKLKVHPDLFFPATKELNYFSYKDLKESSYYKDFKIGDLIKYISLFKKGENCKYKVDASVSYFAYPDVVQRLYDFNPEAKIIIILRDPINRAFSHYLMDRRMGYAHRSFLEYIDNEEAFSSHYHQYIHNSFFSKNIATYREVFGKNQVMVMKLENLDNDISKLFSFLGIKDLSRTISSNEKINANKEAKNFVAAFFQKNRGVTERLKLLIPRSVVNFGNSFLYKAPEKVSMTEEEDKLIRHILKEEIEYYQTIS